MKYAWGFLHSHVLFVLLLSSVFISCLSKGSGGYTVGGGGSGGGVADSSSAAYRVFRAPSVSTPNNRIYPLDSGDMPIIQGTQYAFNFTASDPDGDSTSFTSCTYQTVGLHTSDPNYSSSASCSTLPSLVTTNGVVVVGSATFSAGTLTWTPTNRQRGTYKFTVTASDSYSMSGSSDFYVTVREPYPTTNLIANIDAQVSMTSTSPLNSVGAIPRLNATADDIITTNWLALIGSFSGVLTSMATAAPWSGDGVATTTTATTGPYHLKLNGVADYFNLNTVMTGQTQTVINAWIMPSSAATTSSVLFGDGGLSGNGLVIRQSLNSTGKIEAIVGAKTYSQVVLADAPVGYWRLGEAAGVNATDSSGNALTGTYGGTYTLAQASALTGNSDTSVNFDGASGNMAVADNALLDLAGSLSVEVWIKTSSNVCGTHILEKDDESGFNRRGYHLSICTGSIYFGVGNNAGYPQVNSPGTYNDNSWHHVVGVYRTTDTSMTLFVDGSQVVSSTAGPAAVATNANPLNIGRRNNGFGPDRYFNGNIDEVAVYNTALTPAQIKHHYDIGKQIFQNNPILADNPIGYWKMDESNWSGAASEIVDSSGYGHHATRSGTANVNPNSKQGNAARFSSANVDYATVTITNTLKPIKEASFEGWVKLGSTSAVGADVISIANSLNFRVYSDSQLYLTVYDGAAWDNINSVGATLLDNQWHHIAATKSLTETKVYIDGVLNNTLAYTDSISYFAGNLYIARHATADAMYAWTNGYIDELAMYDYPLSADQIKAHYNWASLRHGCLSSTTFSNDQWNLISLIYDTSTSASRPLLAKLLVNGRQECAFSPDTTFTPSTNFTVGATSAGANPFSGATADIKIHSTPNAAASNTDVTSTFDASSNRFRETQITDIYTSNLIFHFDAASGAGGTRFPGAGCATTTTMDLASSHVIGTLLNFDTCGTYGWQGTGTAAQPYRTVFDGIDSYINFNNPNNIPTGATARTFEAWINYNGTGGEIIGENRPVIAAQQGFLMSIADIAGTWYLFTDGINGANNLTLVGAEIPTAGAWHHIAFTFDGGTAWTYYLDGTNTKSGNFAVAINTSTYVSGVTIGARTDVVAQYFDGSIPIARIYNDDLTQAQIRQNCHAQSARFQGATCAGP